MTHSPPRPHTVCNHWASILAEKSSWDRQTDGKNLVWFGEIERKLAKYKWLPLLTVLPLNYFMWWTNSKLSLSFSMARKHNFYLFSGLGDLSLHDADLCIVHLHLLQEALPLLYTTTQMKTPVCNDDIWARLCIYLRLACWGVPRCLSSSSSESRFACILNSDLVKV